MKINKNDYFKRQVTLTEIGMEGQELLQKAKVLVIGCGGLGSPVAIYLAASGVGEIHLADFDTVSVSNLHRQVFFKLSDLNKPKAQVIANEIKERTPFTKVTFSNKAVEKREVLDLISRFDIVVDATDSLLVKYLINDACVIKQKPLVYGSLYKFDGYVATFNALKENGEYTCNLRDAFPQIASDIPNCETAGTLNPIVGMIALLQVNEVVKLISKTGNLLTDKLLIYNSLQNSQFKLKLKKNRNLNIANIFETSDYTNNFCISQDDEYIISTAEFKKIQYNRNTEVISILNHIDLQLPFKIHQQIPYKNFEVERFEPNYDKNYVIVCKKGITSYDIAYRLKEKFPKLSVVSLDEGIEDY